MPCMAESIDFGSIINPTVPIHCIVQVNDGAPVGNLDIRQAARNFQLFLDAGQYHSPSIGLRVRDPGPGSSLVGQVNWHVDSRVEDQWVIQDFEYALVTEAPNTEAINHATVIDQCEGPDSLERLMCITLELTPQAGWNFLWPANDSTQLFRASLNAVFPVDRL
jgi:hypothetical protein